MGYHCYRNQIAITIVLLLQLLRSYTFVPILSSYNFRRHTPAPIPDWAEILREATYLALTREQNVPTSIRHYLYTAPLIGRQDTATPFGDIAILARGQLYSAPGGFQFVQDPYQNDCDGCHNTEPECHGGDCDVWRPHGRERLLALWSITRIRHRDPSYGHRYELEYTISPMTNPIKSRFVTRNGRLDYSIPGYKFVAVLGSGPTGYTLLPANKYVNKVYRQTDPFNRDNWIPSYPPLDQNTYLPPKSTVKPPLIQLIPPNKPNLEYLPPHAHLLPPEETYDEKKVYKDLLKALESQGTPLGRTTTRKPTPPPRHSSTKTPSEVFDVIPPTKPAATLATTVTTTTTQETTKPVSIEPETHITTRGIPPMLTTISVPKQTIPTVVYTTTPTETTSSSPATRFTFPSHTSSITVTTPISPEITSTPGKVTQIPSKRTTQRFRPVTRPTTDFDVFEKETGPRQKPTSVKIMRVSSTKSYDTDIFGGSLETEQRNLFRATSQAATTSREPYEATTTSYKTTETGTYTTPTGVTTDITLQLSTQPEVSSRNAQPTEITILPTKMATIGDNVRVSVSTEPVRTDSNVMTTVVESSTPTQTTSYSPTSTASTTTSPSTLFTVSSPESTVSTISSTITTTIPPTTTIPFTTSSTTSFATSPVTVLTTSHSTFSPTSSSTTSTPSTTRSTVVPEITKGPQVTEITKPISPTTIPTTPFSQTTRRFKPSFPRTSTMLSYDFPVITPTVPIKVKTTRVFPRRKTTPFTQTTKAYASNNTSTVTIPAKTSTTTRSVSILKPSTTLIPTVSTFQTPTQHTVPIHTTNTQEAPTSFTVSTNGETLMIVTPMPMASSTSIAESQTKEETKAPVKFSKLPSIPHTVARNRIKPNNDEFDDIFGSVVNTPTAPKRADKTKSANSRFDVDDIFGGAEEPKMDINKKLPQIKLNPVLSTKSTEKSSSASTRTHPTIITKKANGYTTEAPPLNQNINKIIFSNFFTPSTNDHPTVTTAFQPSTPQPTEIATSQSFSTSISFETSIPEKPTVSPISIDIESTVMAHVKEIHVNDTGYKIYAAEYPCVIEARTDNSAVLNNDQDLEKYTLSLVNSARSIDYLSKTKAVKKLKRRSERNRKHRQRKIQHTSV